MIHFTTDFLLFLQDLAANNHREWFNNHKKRYESSVKIPFEGFVADLIQAAKQVDDRINITPRQAIFRIHRDTRFSQDKTPYKSYVSAIISPSGRNKMDKPDGFYIEISPEHVQIYSGLYTVEKVVLEKVRTKIADNLEEFETKLNDPDFVKYFGTVRGEQNKRLPKPFETVAKQQPLIANKQFYYFTTLEHDLLFEEALIPTIIERYKIAKPMSDFFEI